MQKLVLFAKIDYLTFFGISSFMIHQTHAVQQTRALMQLLFKQH
jgi:hypothetical protein